MYGIEGEKGNGSMEFGIVGDSGTEGKDFFINDSRSTVP